MSPSLKSARVHVGCVILFYMYWRWLCHLQLSWQSWHTSYAVCSYPNEVNSLAHTSVSSRLLHWLGLLTVEKAISETRHNRASFQGLLLQIRFDPSANNNPLFIYHANSSREAEGMLDYNGLAVAEHRRSSEHLGLNNSPLHIACVKLGACVCSLVHVLSVTSAMHESGQDSDTRICGLPISHNDTVSWSWCSSPGAPAQYLRLRLWPSSLISLLPHSITLYGHLLVEFGHRLVPSHIPQVHVLSWAWSQDDLEFSATIRKYLFPPPHEEDGSLDIR